MIGHTLAKLYGAVPEAKLSFYAERKGLRAPDQAGFRRAFSTIDHIFTLRCLINQAKVRKRRLHCCFDDFRKAFDTVSCDRLFQRFDTRGSFRDALGIFSLHEQFSARVRCPRGTLSSLASNIGVRQGCPLSPTLFGLYIDELSKHILRDGGGGVDLAEQHSQSLIQELMTRTIQEKAPVPEQPEQEIQVDSDDEEDDDKDEEDEEGGDDGEDYDDNDDDDEGFPVAGPA
ncbi:hypothetical protein L7F22_042674 [Adiantum nelumboides]|nr:hypothetical protein [Adiantum nelumboides]